MSNLKITAIALVVLAAAIPAAAQTIGVRVQDPKIFSFLVSRIFNRTAASPVRASSGVPLTTTSHHHVCHNASIGKMARRHRIDRGRAARVEVMPSTRSNLPSDVRAGILLATHTV